MYTRACISVFLSKVYQLVLDEKQVLKSPRMSSSFSAHYLGKNKQCRLIGRLELPMLSIVNGKNE